MNSLGSPITPEEYCGATAENYDRTIQEREALKGPQPILYPQPVRQEIPFEPVFSRSYRIDKPIPKPLPHEGNPGDIAHYQIWPHRDDNHELENQEDILTAFGPVTQPVTYEILATPERTRLLCHCVPVELPLVRGAYQSRLPRLQMNELDEDPAAVYFRDHLGDISNGSLALGLAAVFPPAGMSYAERLTTADSFASNPYASFFQLITELQPGEIMLASVMLTPCAPGHDWQRNIEILNREGFRLKQGGSIIPSTSMYPQQTPDNYLPHEASDTRRKADRDQGFLAVNLFMAGAFAPGRRDRFVLGFQACFSQFRLGGYPFRFLSHEDCLQAFGSPRRVVEVICARLPHWQGWLLSTEEAVSFTQIPLDLDFITQDLVATDYHRLEDVLPELLEEGEHVLAYVEVMGKPVPIYLPTGDSP